MVLSRKVVVGSVDTRHFLLCISAPATIVFASINIERSAFAFSFWLTTTITNTTTNTTTNNTTTNNSTTTTMSLSLLLLAPVSIGLCLRIRRLCPLLARAIALALQSIGVLALHCFGLLHLPALRHWPALLTSAAMVARVAQLQS
jgi:hypothetical protein